MGSGFWFTPTIICQYQTSIYNKITDSYSRRIWLYQSHITNIEAKRQSLNMLLSEYGNMSNTSDSSIANETGKTHTVSWICSRFSTSVTFTHNMSNILTFLNYGKFTDNMSNATHSATVSNHKHNMSNIINIPQLYEFW